MNEQMFTTSERRPWGWWAVVEEGRDYKVKLIHVDAGCRLSYQTHALRSEHWVVAQGHAVCTIDDEAIELGVGDSLDVAVGQRHRIGNDGPDELVIVEIQRGSYLGEDDIVRLDDDYGRVEARP